MSIKLMSAIFETEMRDLDYIKDGEPRKAKASTVKLVLLALADHANDYGESSYPGYDHLALKTALSRQGLSDTIEALKFNGLLRVETRGSRLGTNDYTINIRSFPPMYKESESLPEVVKPLDQPQSSHLTSPSQATGLEPSVNHQRTTRKKGDLLDGMIHFGKEAQEQKADKVEEVLQELERGLRVNIDRSLKNQQIVKRIINDGRPVSKFLDWVHADEWRAAHTYLYAKLEKIWQDFPQAFSDAIGYNPQGLDVGL